MFFLTTTYLPQTKSRVKR